MRRRKALTYLGAGAVCAAGAGSCGFLGGRHRDGRPNIVVILADDWSWPHAGIAGDRTVRTPWFDRVANEGVLCTHAFVSAPSCAPSRAALLTGRYHWELEQAANMWGTFPKKFDCYPHLFDDAGYHAGFCQKGWSPGVLGVHGRMKNPAGQRYKTFKEFLRIRKGTTPLCFWYGSHYPHRRYEWKSGIAQGIDPETVDVPAHLPDVRTVRIDLCDYYGEVQRFDREIGMVYTALEERGELDDTIFIVTSDNGMPFPRCKANLYECGTRVPLAIRWGGIRNPGRIFQGFVSLVDIAPTLFEAVGLESQPPVSGRSLMAVLRDEDTRQLEQQSLTTELTGRERHIAAQEGNKNGYPMRSIRTKQYLYIRNFEPQRWPAGSPPHYRDVDRSPTKQWLLSHKHDPDVSWYFELAFGKRPAEELYDLEKDPGQTVNVAGHQAYTQIREELATRLHTKLEKTEDPRALGKGGKFDEYRYYMLKRIYQ